MNIVLMSGGSGKRLWPISNNARSKQFLKLFKDENNNDVSMFQRIYRQIHLVDQDSNIVIATNISQVPLIQSQIGDDADISVEPCRRDTFPAIALSCAYLKSVKSTDDNEPVVVIPADTFANDDYFNSLKDLIDNVKKGDSNISLMGIVPTEPSEKYGYIIPEGTKHINKVRSFKEKPDSLKAAEYIKDGALWNCGVFAFKLGYILDKTKELLGYSDYETLLEHYDSLDPISFDYAVVEKDPSISVVRYSGEWIDMGTWDTITSVLSSDHIGEGMKAESNRTNVINELNIPILTLGADDLVIAASYDGIIVMNKEYAPKVKEYAERFDNRPMYEERKWGTYKVLSYKDGENTSLTKELILYPGKSISYQRHKKREEIWTVIEGKGRLVLNGEITELSRGDTVIIPAGDMHGIYATEELHIIEVQIGSELVEDDIERFDWEWK